MKAQVERRIEFSQRAPRHESWLRRVLRDQFRGGGSIGRSYHRGSSKRNMSSVAFRQSAHGGDAPNDNSGITIMPVIKPPTCAQKATGSIGKPQSPIIPETTCSMNHIPRSTSAGRSKINTKMKKISVRTFADGNV